MGSSNHSNSINKTIDDAIERLSSGIMLLLEDVQSAKSRKPRVENDTANKDLMAALEANDPELVEQALTGGANPDFDKGAPLRFCAERDDYKMAKQLFFSGADFTIAQLKAKTDLDLVPMEYNKRPPSPKKGHETAYYKYKRILTRLEDFYQRCRENIPVQNSIKLDKILENQKNLALQLTEFRKFAEDLTSPLREAKPRTQNDLPMPKG